MWSLTTDPGATLDVDVLRRIGELAGVQTWPVVLDMWAADDDTDAMATSATAADREIRARGLIDGGEPIAWMATALRVLAAPERQIEMRMLFAVAGEETGIRRICLARNGHDHVFARRQGSRVELRLVDVTAESELGTIVAREFPPAESARFGGLSVPADELASRLATCQSANDAADALHALGAVSSDAVAIATALTSCHTRTEIVGVSWSGGVSTQSSGALAIFDTDRGRIVASPSKSPDGRVWTTLSAGSGHRITQAVGLLIETLPEGRWMP